jgi:hypothetical protein
MTVGMGTPARVGVSLIKAARRTGKITAHMAKWLSRSMRDMVDWGALTRSMNVRTLAQPVVAVRAAREAVKVDKSEEFMRAVGDIGRVQGRAGTQAAVDGLKIAQGPRDLSRVARLAETKGTRTRAILKTLGRGAIFLASTSFSLASWLFSALMTLIGFCAACKRAAKRATERYCERRRARRMKAQLRAVTAARA